MRSYVCGEVSQSDIHLKGVCGYIESAAATVIDVVELMEPYLTSWVDAERSRASYLLYQLISMDAVRLASSSEIHVFAAFLCHRLGDFPSLPSCLLALRVLFDKYGHLMDPGCDDCAYAVAMLSSSVHTPSYSQPVRQSVFDLVLAVLCSPAYSHQPVLQFLCSALDGEKDPRCLLSAFGAIDKSLGMLPGSLDRVLGESVLEALGCYFPIDFAPRTGESHAVTPAMLAEALSKALCDHRSFVPLTLPFLLDQASKGEGLQARRTALICLRRIVSCFGHSVCLRIADADWQQDPEESQSFLQHFSDVLYDVGVNEGSQVLVDEVLQLLAAVNFSICNSAQLAKADWEGFQRRILLRAVVDLSENVESLKGRSAWRLCITLAGSGGAVAAERVAQMLFPMVLKEVRCCSSAMAAKLSGGALAVEQKVLPEAVQMMLSLLCCAMPIGVDCTFAHIGDILPRFDSIVELLARFVIPFVASPPAVVSRDCQRALTNSINAMREVIARWGRSLLLVALVEDYVDNVFKLLFFGRKLGDERAAIKNLLVQLIQSPQFAHMVYAQVDTMLNTAHCDDVLAAVVRADPADHVIKTLSQRVLVLIPVNSNENELFIGRLMKVFNEVLSSPVELTDNVSLQRKLSVIVGFQENGDISHGTSCLLHLLAFLTVPASATSSTGLQLRDDFALFMRSTFEHLPKSLQTILFTNVCRQLGGICNGETGETGDDCGDYSLRLLLMCLVHLDKSCYFFCEPTNSTSGTVINNLLCYSALDAFMCVALIVNKVSVHEVVARIVDAAASRITNSQLWLNGHAEEQQAAVNLFLWVAKGVLMRLPNATWVSLLQRKITQLLGEMLTTGDGGQITCRAESLASRIDILIAEHRFVLTNAANKRSEWAPFWQQKLYATLFPALRADLKVMQVLPGNEQANPIIMAQLLCFCQLVVHISCKEVLFVAADVPALLEVLMIAVCIASQSVCNPSALRVKLEQCSLKSLEICLCVEQDVAQHLVSHLNVVVPFLERVSSRFLVLG